MAILIPEGSGRSVRAGKAAILIPERLADTEVGVPEEDFDAGVLLDAGV